MNKKILIFSISYDPFIGGAEVAVKEITNRINDVEWHMICMWAPGLPKIQKIGNIIVNRIKGPKILFPFLAFIKAYKMHNKERFDITWSIMTYAGFAGLFFKIFFPKVKFLLTLQEGTPISDIKLKAFVVYPLFCLMFRKADMIQAISKFLATFARDMGHKKEIEIIANGVDIEKYSKIYPREEIEKIKQTLGKNQNDIYLVTTSRLVEKNAVDDIISSLTCLPKNIYLIVIGEGEEGLKLQKQAIDLKVADRVKFLGFIPQDEIPKYLSACEIFVRPSRSEGFGISFIEAMASRIPVIATPVGGIVDFIDDKETGFFCSPDNPKSLAVAVGFIVRNPDLVEYVVKKAYDRVVSKYSWNLIAEQMKNRVFDKI